MHMTSLPVVVAAALPRATATTIEIILDPRCHIHVIDGRELSEPDVERVDDAVLFWRAMIASETGLVVERLHTTISLPPAKTNSGGITDAMAEFGRLRHVTLTVGDMG